MYCLEQLVQFFVMFVIIFYSCIITTCVQIISVSKVTDYPLGWAKLYCTCYCLEFLKGMSE